MSRFSSFLAVLSVSLFLGCGQNSNERSNSHDSDVGSMLDFESFLLRPITVEISPNLNIAGIEIDSGSYVSLLSDVGGRVQLHTEKWSMTEKDSVFFPNSTRSLQLSSGKFWIIEENKITFATRDIIDSTVSGPFLDQENTTDLSIVGVYEDALFLFDRGNRKLLHLSVNSTNQLTRNSYQLHDSFGGLSGALAAGMVNKIWLWLWTEESIFILASGVPTKVLAKSANTVHFDSGVEDSIKGMALRIVASEEGTLKISGPMIAQGDAAFYFASSSSGNRSWSEILPYVDQYCRACHPTYTDEKAFSGEGDLIRDRLTSDNASLRMPPADAKEALSDEIRSELVEWLKE